jgi:hypothetical protein
LSQDSGGRQPTNAHVDPNVAFPFQDNFSIGTIHRANQKTSTPGAAAAQTATEVVEIQDNKDNVSVLTAKTTSKILTDVAIGSRFASGSNPVSGPTSISTQSGATSGGLEDPASDSPAGRAVGGPRGKWSSQIPPLHPREEGQAGCKADCHVSRQLQGARGASIVHWDINVKKQPVGSISYCLHV